MTLDHEGSRLMLFPENSLAVELLDSTQSQALHVWEFSATTLIRIGRSPDNDVAVGSPYVSRAHANLRFAAGQWELWVLSDKGVYVDGCKVDSLLVHPGTVFRLSPQGPYLRIAAFSETGRDREVEAVTKGDYFNSLQKIVDKLRARHHS